jgi:hypothetical protein
MLAGRGSCVHDRAWIPPSVNTPRTERVVFRGEVRMETRLTLAPGQNGTKKLLARYGDRLVCVRYRYDSERAVRHKTVELIVETTR